MMMSEYEDWITDNVTKPYGKCAEYTEEMQKVFPELIKVRGHYYCIIWGERAHWWLKTINGVIIDPTKSQFPSNGTGKYVEHTEGSPEPTGKCVNCGKYIFDGSYHCSDKCVSETVNFINRGARNPDG